MFRVPLLGEIGLEKRDYLERGKKQKTGSQIGPHHSCVLGKLTWGEIWGPNQVSRWESLRPWPGMWYQEPIWYQNPSAVRRSG